MKNNFLILQIAKVYMYIVQDKMFCYDVLIEDNL